MTDDTSERTVAGMNPATPVKAPSEAEFGDEFYLGGDGAGKIEEYAEALLRDGAAGFGDLLESGASIGYLWRKKSAKVRGREVGASLKRASGLVGYALEADYILEVSAAYVRENRLNHRQFEAMIYAELKHALIEILEDGETRFALRPHDFEGFSDEIARYGLWRLDLEAAARSFDQAPLFDLATKPETGDSPQTAQDGSGSTEPEKRTESRPRAPRVLEPAQSNATAAN